MSSGGYSGWSGGGEEASVGQWQRPAAPRGTNSGGVRANSGAGGRPQAASRPTPVSKPAVPLPDYAKGDMVNHKAFGNGMVLSVQKMGGDALVEIAFDNVGTKRLMLKTAAQHMSKA